MDEKRGLTRICGSMLLVIFAVLCLTAFSLLCLTAVNSGTKLQQKSLAATEAYYRADCRAEEILSLLRAGILPDGVTREQEIYSYRCTVSDTQLLWVEARVTGTEYTVLRWQVVPAEPWQAEQSIPVWDGETP